MARCDHCGKEVTLPFSCPYSRGKFCDECRLPPTIRVRISGYGRKTPSLCRAFVQERWWSDCYR